MATKKNTEDNSETIIICHIPKFQRNENTKGCLRYREGRHRLDCRRQSNNFVSFAFPNLVMWYF